jgi:hypothetical protein
MNHSLQLIIAVATTFFALQVGAQDLTWRNDIEPIIKAQCSGCHGNNAPVYEDWELDKKALQAKNIGPRINTYPDFMRHVVWPATGSMMRRLDDGENAGGKPGNMFVYLGDTPADRAKNLAMIKSWLGAGGWNLNRWGARNDVPGITKEQLDKVKAKY